MGQCKTQEMFSQGKREEIPGFGEDFQSSSHICVLDPGDSKMTQTWSCLEDPTHNIVTSTVMIMRGTYRGGLSPNRGVRKIFLDALPAVRPVTGFVTPQSVDFESQEGSSHTKFSPRFSQIPQACLHACSGLLLVITSFLCPEIHLVGRTTDDRALLKELCDGWVGGWMDQ